MTAFGLWWNTTPRLLRDFVEGTLSAGIGGAVSAVLGLNLSDATLTAKQVAAAAVVGAISAVIAYARHRLATP